jgi:hypothetical protein
VTRRYITGCDAVHPDRRGGQHVAMRCTGVLVIDDDRSLGVMCNSERSQHGNRTKAEAMLRGLIENDAAKLSQSRQLVEQRDVENASLREQLKAAEAKAAVIGGEACLEERARGNGPCGACAVCCRDARQQLAAAQAECERLTKGQEGLHAAWKTALADNDEAREQLATVAKERDAMRPVFDAAVEWSESFGELSKRLPPHVHKLRAAIDSATRGDSDE